MFELYFPSENSGLLMLNFRVIVSYTAMKRIPSRWTHPHGSSSETNHRFNHNSTKLSSCKASCPGIAFILLLHVLNFC